jgi:stage III sporulation protein SpoIIIAA
MHILGICLIEPNINPTDLNSNNPKDLRLILNKKLNFSAFHCRIVIMECYEKAAILRDLQKKTVLLAGPRQAGKTTLCKDIKLIEKSRNNNFNTKINQNQSHLTIAQ